MFFFCIKIICRLHHHVFFINIRNLVVSWLYLKTLLLILIILVILKHCLTSDCFPNRNKAIHHRFSFVIIENRGILQWIVMVWAFIGSIEPLINFSCALMAEDVLVARDINWRSSWIFRSFRILMIDSTRRMTPVELVVLFRIENLQGLVFGYH